ncbi:hypothetical protein AAG906_008053 [Vitis piasezkii]
MSTVSIPSRNIEGHILPFHSIFFNSFRLEMFWISSLSKPHIQPFLHTECLGLTRDQIHVIQRLSGIVPGSPSHFDGSPASCLDPLVISAALRHRARIPSHSTALDVVPESLVIP